MIKYDEYVEMVKEWDWYKIYGAFFKENGNLCGYALLSRKDECIEFNVLRTIPDYERHGINAAIVNMILCDNVEFLSRGGYISDGARSINHETKFQDYLEKYFDFRKAYCKLHIKYNPKIRWFIKCIYPIRRILFKFDSFGIMHKINAILKMEDIVRNQD